MAKFVVTLEYIYHKEVEVEAETEAEALENAQYVEWWDKDGIGDINSKDLEDGYGVAACRID